MQRLTRVAFKVIFRLRRLNPQWAKENRVKRPSLLKRLQFQCLFLSDLTFHTDWIWIWITKRPGATSDNGFIFKEMNKKRKEKKRFGGQFGCSKICRPSKKNSEIFWQYFFKRFYDNKNTYLLCMYCKKYRELDLKRACLPCCDYILHCRIDTTSLSYHRPKNLFWFTLRG